LTGAHGWPPLFCWLDLWDARSRVSVLFPLATFFGELVRLHYVQSGSTPAPRRRRHQVGTVALSTTPDQREVTMRRLTLSLVLTGLGVLTPGFAMAQCPALIDEVNKATANRYDPAAASAKQKALEAAKLDKAGKPAECEKAAKEALAMIGVKK
jgi:hypothetical protein